MAEPMSKKERIDRCLRKMHGEKVKPIRVTKDDVFRYLCEIAASINPYPKISSVSRIAGAFAATEYNVRKCIKELTADGLVQRSHDGGMEDGNVWCCHGFGLTKAGYETATYKECDRKAVEEMGEFLKKGHEEWMKEQEGEAAEKKVKEL